MSLSILAKFGSSTSTSIVVICCYRKNYPYDFGKTGTFQRSFQFTMAAKRDAWETGLRTMISGAMAGSKIGEVKVLSVASATEQLLDIYY